MRYSLPFFRQRSEQSPIAQYGVAFLCAVAAVLLRLLLSSFWGLRLPYLTFYPAVAVAAWLSGFRPGVVTAVLCAVAADYFFLPPTGSLAIADTSDIVGMAVYLFVSGIIASFSGAAHARRRMLGELLSSIGDGFIAFDRDWRLTFVNERAAALLERPRAALIGTSLWNELPELIGTALEREARRAVAEHRPHQLDFYYERRSMWLEVRMAPLREGLAMYVEDITERKRAEEAAVRLAAIVQWSDDAIVAKNLDGIITSWNPAAERLFGFTAAEAIGNSITMIIPFDRRDEEDEVLRRIRRGEIVDHFETIRMRKDGTRIDVSVTISPVRNRHGVIIGASKIARDIGERKRVEAERNALLAREQAARAEAEAANRAKDEFLAVLSHELRTPLNAVYGWARMLQSGQLDAATSARALDVIVRNANAQVQLIDDLLDVSRVITGKMRLDVRLMDVMPVVEGAIDAVRPAAEAKDIQIDAVLDPRAGPVSGDPDRLQQVVWNLVMNAVKFTPKGGRVQVHLERVSSHVEIVVSDTGQGIVPEVLPRIFDRFTQADTSSTRAHTGLGLGLALVKHLVELHGGVVSAHSDGVGRGATFVVKLPLAVAQVPGRLASRAHPTAVAAPPSPTGIRLDGVRVLVVDDDPAAVELVSTILAGAGALVRASGAAADAIGTLVDWRPDVLVSDIEMPGEDGYALIRKVRALDAERGGRTPSIALTAYGRPTDRMRTLSAGYNMHVPKPVDPEELTTIVANVAGRLPESRRAM